MSLGESLFMHTCHMPPPVILSLAHFVAQGAWVGPTNRVFPLNVTPHVHKMVGIATEKADETGSRLHN